MPDPFHGERIDRTGNRSHRPPRPRPGARCGSRTAGGRSALPLPGPQRLARIRRTAGGGRGRRAAPLLARRRCPAGRHCRPALAGAPGARALRPAAARCGGGRRCGCGPGGRDRPARCRPGPPPPRRRGSRRDPLPEGLPDAHRQAGCSRSPAGARQHSRGGGPCGRPGRRDSPGGPGGGTTWRRPRRGIGRSFTRPGATWPRSGGHGAAGDGGSGQGRAGRGPAGHGHIGPRARRRGAPSCGATDRPAAA